MECNYIFYFLPGVGFIALFYALLQARWVSKQYPGNDKMILIAQSISQGAVSFLKTVNKNIGFFVIAVSILLGYMGIRSDQFHPMLVVTFIIGALFSGFSGWLGMEIATKANVRTAEAAKSSLVKSFKIAFAGGSVMGVGVTGMAFIGLSGLFIIFYNFFLPDGLNACNKHLVLLCLETLTGFSLGAESVALFARVAGGIYTKAADVGADIVGKIEAGIPEDDPRNPATIADNVGDNVGDIAGMGADLFGSYVATILAAMVLGSEVLVENNPLDITPLLLPLFIAGIGILFSLGALFFVKIRKDTDSVQGALNKGNWIASILTTIATYFLIIKLLPTNLSMRMKIFTAMDLFYTILIGLAIGVIMSYITEYFTAMDKKPVQYIIKQSCSGHATNIIAGLTIGMFSTVLPILFFAIGIYASFYFAGFYGVAIAAVGMMSTTTLQLSIDAFGPIADNAGGIAEMGGLPAKVRTRTDMLDAVGNTTAAIGKGFAIASAALTSLALFAAYVKIARIDTIDVYKTPVLVGLFIGSVIPFFFSALVMHAVGRAAMSMVAEVRRQFNEIKGILEGSQQPDYEKCVSISTKAALKAIRIPGAVVILTPIFIGFCFGPEVLGGMLVGLTVSGILMALFQTNSGGAWDNAKKSFEKGVKINGNVLYKGSEAHKASITGDTVGDPFKDTSGPSMNIVIKLTTIVALIMAPYIAVPNSSYSKVEKIYSKGKHK